MDFIELYSCFPSAVRIFARELGLSEQGELTVTGGMAFGGGPLNNFVLQATAKLVQCLRQKPNSRGLISSVSGMNTKQGFGLWSTEPEAEFRFDDVTKQVAKQSRVLDLVEPIAGEASIVGITVRFDRGEPQRAVAIVEYPDQGRTVVSSELASIIKLAMSEECVGRQVLVSAAGHFTMAADAD